MITKLILKNRLLSKPTISPSVATSVTSEFIITYGTENRQSPVYDKNLGTDLLQLPGRVRLRKRYNYKTSSWYSFNPYWFYFYLKSKDNSSIYIV